MLILATDKPDAELQDGRIVLTIPSGKDRIEIALSLNQALCCQEMLKRATRDAYDTGFAATAADVIKLPAKRRKATKSTS